MRKVISYFYIYIIFSSVYLTTTIASSAGNSWPSVKEEKREYVFSNANDAHVILNIYSVNNQNLYDLQCHPGDYNKDPFFDYSGFFHCRLRSLYTKEELGSLLTDSFEETKEWENRGRFLVEHLLPGHENYTDWGRERHFRLRGIEIIFKIWDESFKKQNNELSIEAFKFSVEIRNSPSSIREISEPPAKPRPKWFYGE